MKKMMCAGLAMTMALSLTACGGSGGGNTASTSGSGESSAAADGGATTLTIWQPTDKASIEAWWVEKIGEWNAEHPELQVKREAIDRSDSYAYENKVTTAVTSNDLPDILFVDGPTVSYYAANGIIVPLTEYFSEEDMADFTPSTVAQGTYDG